MKDGFYDRVESELQGHRNTYYVGGLFAFELTERNSSYAMALICKHFASANSLPTFPYVKVSQLTRSMITDNGKSITAAMIYCYILFLCRVCSRCNWTKKRPDLKH